MPVHIHEFLYRGRADGSAEPPAWHLTLVSVGVDDFGEAVRSERTLNMAQAEAAGWPLPKIIGEINANTLTEIEARRDEIAGLEAELEETKQGKAAAETTVLKLDRKLEAQTAELSEAKALAAAAEQRAAEIEAELAGMAEPSVEVPLSSETAIESGEADDSHAI